ncbi:hypothetical protein RU96_GL000335 [Enterococcus canintestini]|uniref:Uncharacterized protein n=1 Tax=Enterococcus canintestini TaxID=317010 RepID=A0A1L8R5U3_9ENTE|nr:hypothetical protein RU96_GL000335 [Enterococcus canintestini]
MIHTVVIKYPQIIPLTFFVTIIVFLKKEFRFTYYKLVYFICLFSRLIKTL